MEIAFFIYLASKTGVITITLLTLSCICAGFLVVFTLNVCDRRSKVSDEEEEKHKYPLSQWHGKLLLFTAIVLAVAGALVPNERTMYLMAGGYMGQKAFESETTARIIRIINNKLDSYMEDIEKSTFEKLKK